MAGLLQIGQSPTAKKIQKYACAALVACSASSALAGGDHHRDKLTQDEFEPFVVEQRLAANKNKESHIVITSSYNENENSVGRHADSLAETMTANSAKGLPGNRA